MPILARDKVVVSVLDDPPQDRSLTLEENDLTTERRSGGGDAKPSQEIARPGAGRNDHLAAGDWSDRGPDGRDSCIVGLEAQDSDSGPNGCATLCSGDGQC